MVTGPYLTDHLETTMFYICYFARIASTANIFLFAVWTNSNAIPLLVFMVLPFLFFKFFIFWIFVCDHNIYYYT
jgi:hypothetical protein